MFDHLIRTPGDRAKNDNRDAWSHNDAWTHNQTATKILAYHELCPNGVAKEVTAKEFVEQGLKGVEIKEAMNNKRIAVVQKIKATNLQAANL